MEEAGRFKPELIKAIFDQGVSDCVCVFILILFDVCIVVGN